MSAPPATTSGAPPTSRGADELRPAQDQRREQHAPQRLGGDERRDDGHAPAVVGLEERDVREPEADAGDGEVGQVPQRQRAAADDERVGDGAHTARRERRRGGERRVDGRVDREPAHEVVAHREDDRRREREDEPGHLEVRRPRALADEQDPAEDDQDGARAGARRAAARRAGRARSRPRRAARCRRRPLVRDGPASRTASVKRSCDAPGPSTPASRNGQIAPRSTSPAATNGRVVTSAIAIVSAAPTSAPAPRASAKRSATVIAPKRKAEQQARRTASTAAAGYRRRPRGACGRSGRRRSRATPTIARVTDPRVAAYARLLVGRCIDPAPGAQVLVATTTEARPLAEELSRELARRGAYALTRIHFGGLYPVDVAWLEEAPPELAFGLPPLEQELVDRVDGAIFVLAPADPPRDAALTAEQRRAFRAQLVAYRTRGRAGLVREVRCDFPTPYFAREAGLSLAAYEDEFYAACLRDWDAEGRRMRARPRALRPRGRGAHRRRRDGRDAEPRRPHRARSTTATSTSPAARSSTARSRTRSRGRCASTSRPARSRACGSSSAAARSSRRPPTRARTRCSSALGTDAGARRFGELGLGCNEGITRHLRNVLFDEKMAGTVHLALGHGFPRIGGRNESALHWDLVKDLRPGGEIECDGEVVQRDGRWLI